MLEDYFFTKHTKWVLWGLLALIVAALIFHAGVVVGLHDRGIPDHNFDKSWFEAQIPFGGGILPLPQGFIPGGHGAFGTIASITLPTIRLTTRDGVTLTIKVDNDTQIVGATPEGTSSPMALKVEDTIVVLGDPDDMSSNGAVDARLIRILTH
ncbi:MAG: hypothetical protein ABSE76_03345 [Minisyncoccia bacterium]|jgi:hypothetical protein